ncbi:MAG: tyrosine-type recombinase/integrase [Planctomycetota bacterium]|jgi:integrase
MATQSKSFRVGRVSLYLRGRVWYLCYHQAGRRYRPRVGPDRDSARRLAAQINAQLEAGAPSALSFEQVTIPELRTRWLEHHENVRRSSLATIRRYRAATEHLIRFASEAQPVRFASQFEPRHAETFAAYLRTRRVAPNGHPNASKRPLRDKGVKFVLESCRTMFNFAAKRRHLSPYAENPFTTIEIDRIPVEDAPPFVGLTETKEQAFLERCDDWQLPVFITLLLTGLRSGELTHLLLPDDLDLENAWLHVRNKPGLGWQVKTRNERRIPLVKELVDILGLTVGRRSGGTVFQRRRFLSGPQPPLATFTRLELQNELARRIEALEEHSCGQVGRAERLAAARTAWRDLGMIKPDRIRVEFMRITRQTGLPEVTAPKTLRHQFATALQDANVDPLIRNQLMGHAPTGAGSVTSGLGMTGVYTHTRPETLRRQLEQALSGRSALDVARGWLKRRASVRGRRQTA